MQLTRSSSAALASSSAERLLSVGRMVLKEVF
jgi:hypothetical protein